jgi:hypothetical protein
MASKNEVVETLKILLSAYPAKEIRDLEAFAEICFRSWKPYSHHQLTAAAYKHIGKVKFFPAISEICNLADEINPNPRTEERNVRTPDNAYFVEQMKRFETMRPEDWQPNDYRIFERIMKRKINWENEPSEAPWAWWKEQEETNA